MNFNHSEIALKKSLLCDLKFINLILKNLEQRVLIDFASKSKKEREIFIKNIEKDIENIENIENT